VNYSKRNWTLILAALLFLVLLGGCKKKVAPTPPPPPPPPAAPTATLSASPGSIQTGQSSTLTWSTEHATNVTLDGAAVDPNGSKSVSPTQTTTYHLTAKGDGGSQDATATVTVTAPPPPPPPPPAPAPSDEEVFSQNVKDIYFDFDSADIRADAQQTLAHTAQILSQHPNWVIEIAGNCDERGSTEYNLALGERRAKSAHDFLVKNGVGADHLKTRSYGKEKPVCTESNEDCWQRNRRGAFTLVSH